MSDAGTTVDDAATQWSDLFGLVHTTRKHKPDAVFHLAAQALRAAKEEADRANRAKDRFLAVLSHELRTPLAPITTAVHVLEKAARLDERHRDLLPMIRRNVALEARLIDDLLDLTAIASGKVRLERSRVDMHRLVQAVVTMYSFGDGTATGVTVAAAVGPSIGPCCFTVDERLRHERGLAEPRHRRVPGAVPQGLSATVRRGR